MYKQESFDKYQLIHTQIVNLKHLESLMCPAGRVIHAVGRV